MIEIKDKVMKRKVVINNNNYSILLKLSQDSEDILKLLQNADSALRSDAK